MYKILRKKVASTVNDIDAPEQFEWLKWLRTPHNESLPIESIYHTVQNFGELNLELTVPTSEKIEISNVETELLEGKYQKKFFIPKVKTNKVFLKLGRPHIKKIQLFDPSGTDIVFSSKVEHKDNKTLVTNKLGKASANVMKLDTLVQNYSFPVSDPIISKLDFVPDKPVTYDKMDRTENKVTKIELLNVDDDDAVKIENYDLLMETPDITYIDVSDIRKLLDSLYKQKIDTNTLKVKIDYLNSAPQIAKAKILNQENLRVPTYYLKNIFLNKTKISVNLLQNIPEVETYQKELSSYNSSEPAEEEIVYLPVYEDQSILEYVDHLLNDEQPSTNLDTGHVVEETKDIKEFEESQNLTLDLNDYLLEFQKEGVKFLIKNKKCLINDEPGLGKTVQAVFALKMLLEDKKIKSFLVVCRSEQIGNQAYSEQLGKLIGWEGYLTKFLDNDSFSRVVGDKEERKKIWGEKKSGYLATYEDLVYDVEIGSLSNELLSSIDCLIFDDAEELSKVKKEVSSEVKNISSNYTWYFSGQPDKYIIETLQSIGEAKSPIPTLRRIKEELFGKLPNIIRKEVWVDLDEEQRVEYDNTLQIGKEKISKLLQAGNPFIVQSNIYTLLHQLKQIFNFSESKNSSPKSESLIKKVEQLVRNDKKVMIVSQYDKLGTNKIAQLLREHDISYLSCNNGMSITELENVKKQFKRDRKISVLINGLKSSRSSRIAEVGYFIHFDQWWNPSTVWKMEDTISKPHEENYRLKENIIIYEYFAKNTFEEELRKLLYKKGLLQKDIIELLNAETINEIVSIDEWMEILGINSNTTEEEPISDKLKLISQGDLTRKIEIFFSRIGYKNVSLSKGKRAGEFNMVGTLITENKKIKMAAKCLLSEEYSTDDIMEGISTLELDKYSEKKFLIHFNESSENVLSLLKSPVVVINKDLLANYLSDFLLI